MDYCMYNLSENELLEITGGWDWEYFTYAVAAVGCVAGVVGCAPVAVVCGVYEGAYWLTKAVVN